MAVAGPATVAGTHLQVLKLRSDLKEVAQVRALIAQAGAREGLSLDLIFDMQVAASEACANAIEHANSEVQVLLWWMVSQVVAEIKNVGKFRPRPRTANECSRGMGVGLMVSLADKVEIAGKDPERTTIRLWFNRRGVSPDPAEVEGLELGRS
ncbi:MAG TPA: ATP-binding protein [Chloroflexota bacterium]|nr:ATP-binding protein [Chloroflexota bacterium]